VGDRASEFLKISQRINRAEWGWFGLNPDGSILTARDNGTNEIYALDLDLP
jgi:hypothetical protein